MAIDKETLAKHSFWIGFAVLIVLVFATLLFLSTVSAETIAKQKATLDQHRRQLIKHEQDIMQRQLNLQNPEPKPPYNNQDLAKLQERLKQLEQRREEIWEKAWLMQKDLMGWPADLQESLGKLRFGSPIDVKDCAAYARPDVYDPQISKQLGDIFKIELTQDKEKTVLELAQFDGGWEKVLNYVGKQKDKTGIRWVKLPPTFEEVWLAQEDFWVQREILKALQESVLMVGKFRKVEGEPKAADQLYREHFENAYWRLDLNVVKTTDNRFAIRGKIKNISDRQLPLGRIHFQVWLSEGNVKPIVLPIEGDALPVNNDWPIAEHRLDLANRPDGILGVAQIFEGRTSPLRRVDQIVLGHPAHRTYRHPKMGTFSIAPDTAMPALGKPGAPVPLPLPKLDKGKEGELARTDNGLLRERYSDVTPQVRRLPVALKVLVDQQHIPEVEAALVNSKFRFQIVQVGWHHFRGGISVPDGDRDGAPRPATGKLSDLEQGEQQSNLVELVVYCTASLYERYEPGAAGAGGPVAAPKAPQPPKAPVPPAAK
jgi:hypothetical protein